MLRKSTANIIHLVDDQIKSTIVLDGRRGVGKTTCLMQSIHHFAQKQWIVVPLMQISDWFSGIEPYEQLNAIFTQPTLSAKILKTILLWNKKQMDSSLTAVAEEGIKNHLVADNALETVLMTFVESNQRVLLAFDQFNALYSKTAYHDPSSAIITADKFFVASLLHRIVGSITPTGSMHRVSVLAGMDYTHPFHKSNYLEAILRSTKPCNSDHGLLSHELSTFDFSNRDEFGIKLPKALDPLNGDLFASEAKDIPKPHVTRYIVPAYSQDEIKSVLEYYNKVSIIHSPPTDSFALKNWMVTQGNPLEVFKSFISV